MLVAAATLLFAFQSVSWIPYALLPMAAFLAVLGAKTQSSVKEIEEETLNFQSKSELLQAQIDDQRSSIDALADGLEVGILICDANANVLYANRRANELFRTPNARGKSLIAITFSYDLERLVLNATKERTVQRAELVFTHPQELVGIAQAWTGTNANQVFVSIYEITDLRRLERIRQDFVANVSHELRTPLTIIRATSETLLDNLDDAEKKEHAEDVKYLTRIIGEVDRLSLLTNDLLTLSASESVTPRKQTANLAFLVRRAVQSLQERAEAKQIQLSYSGLETLLIEANENQMSQVALNLIENAINYTNEGSVEVSVHSEDETAVFTITDTGIGVSSEHLNRIFERFYRVDRGRSRNTGGTGLGLSIVKHIVEAHGGKVFVSSRLHEGSKFTVKLPIGNVSETRPDPH